MKATRTDASNAILTLPGGTKANDLYVVNAPIPDHAAREVPAEIIEIHPPADEADLHAPTPGFETTWLPDEIEREALIAGSPVYLRIWGTGHPPVAVGVYPLPDDIPVRPGLDRDHADRALGALLGLMLEAGMLRDHPTRIAGDVTTLWQQAIDATAQQPEHIERMIAQLTEEAHRHANASEQSTTAEDDGSDSRYLQCERCGFSYPLATTPEGERCANGDCDGELVIIDPAAPHPGVHCAQCGGPVTREQLLGGHRYHCASCGERVQGTPDA